MRIRFNNYCRLNTGREILLVFLFLFKIGSAQSFEEVKKRVIKFYQQPYLSYSFQKDVYISNGKVRMHFDNQYLSYKIENNVFELLDISLHKSRVGKAMKFTVVSNKSYYGANIINPSTSDSYYLNYYSSQPYPLASLDSVSIFNQSDALNVILNRKQYKTEVLDLDTFFLLQLRDTTKTASSWPGINTVNLLINYFISKKDGSIKQLTWQSSMEVNGRIDRTDSCIYTYSYYKLPKKEIVKKINAFVPFPEKDITQERSRMLDSLKYTFEQIKTFPEFNNLPDSSEIICKSSAITSKYVMVDFWYKNCGPCLMNMKYVEEIRQKFRKSDLEVIAINMADSLDADTKKVVRDFNTTYTWLFNGQDLNKSLNIYSYPTTLIYDNETREIIYRHVGASEAYAKTIISFLNSRLNEE